MNRFAPAQNTKREIIYIIFSDLKLYFRYKLMTSSTAHESALQSFKLLVICFCVIASRISVYKNKWHRIEINLCAEHGMMRA